MAGIIAGALGGFGEALGNIGARQMQADLDRDTRRESATLENDLALQRAKAIEQLKMDMHNAALNRLSAKAQQYAGEEVPREARSVTSVGGEIPLEEGEMGPKREGFVGDVGVISKAIAKLPDGPDKQAALAQLRRQVGGEQAFEEGIVAGKMRKRTSDEALNAAVEDAKASDLPAYGAYEKEIGKPLREERKIDQQAARDDARVSAAATADQRKAEAEMRRNAIDLKRLDLQQGNLDAQNRRIDALIEHWERSDENKANKAEKGQTPERLYSIVNSMNQTIRGLNEAGAPRDAAAKAEWQNQMDTAVRVRSRAQMLLDQNLEDRGAPTSKPPASAPKPSGARPPLSNFMR